MYWSCLLYHTLSLKQWNQYFCKRLAILKVPDGYNSNIAKCISMDECKMVGLKPHDCHILMQQLIHVALRGILSKGAWNNFLIICILNELCIMTLDKSRLE